MFEPAASQSLVEEAFRERALLEKRRHRTAVLATVKALDRGEVRVAEPGPDGEWVTHAWVKEAVLLFFALRKMKTHEVGPFEFYDKIPLKKGLAKANVRVVPPGTVRYGAFLEPGCIVMPGYVNIGAYVGAGRWSTPGPRSGAARRSAKTCHLSGGVGIGGVLEPPSARGR
jgi:2,3,4,5-tetrahydropyridine-2-carboxylate N-succinyltransferase